MTRRKYLPLTNNGLASQQVFPTHRRSGVPLSLSHDQMLAAGKYGDRWNVYDGVTYERKNLPSPGTQNYAYENLGLVEFSPIGPAIANRKQFMAFQPKTPFYLQAVPYQGVGGLTMGQMILQPLINPNPNTSEDTSQYSGG